MERLMEQIVAQQGTAWGHEAQQQERERQGSSRFITGNSPMSQVPSLFAPILHQSRMNPDAIAVVAESSTSTYAEFCSHIENVTRRLDALAIPAGSRVAVQVASQYFGWLLVIALS